MPFTHGHAVVNVWILGQWHLPRNDHRLWLPIILGGMMPDFPLLIFMILEIPKHGASLAFGEIYFEQQWQDVFGYFHSIPLSLMATLGFGCISIPVYAKAAEQTTTDLLTNMWNRTRKVGKSDPTANNNKTSMGRDSNIERDIEDPPPPSVPNTDSLPIGAAVFWTQSAWMFAASMFLHALADLGLHTSDAHSQLLPFSRFKVRSRISYYEVTEYAWIWMPIEATLVFFACRYMWVHMTKRCSRFLVGLVVATYCVILVGTIVSAIRLIA